ncbi:MAG: prephenate dehydrogenase [Elusimicrobia bacterium]|nr:prephenate dehydrogenase [Elusimicrobiota bacterium]
MIIAIIGVGLIGGSIGMALKQIRNPKSEIRNRKIIGIGRNINRLKVARKLGAVDEVTTDIKKGVKDADVIFVCLPVDLIPKTVKIILSFCKKDAIITDVGSVKSPIVNEVEKFLFPIRYPLSPAFIGGHPIAGSEKTSVKYASKDLYKNANVILTPTRKTDKNSVNIIKKIWQKLGAKVSIMSVSKHDNILSFTSHLPHVAAFSLVNTVDDLKFIGPGFRDTTRIAASAPEMWADIIFSNRIRIKDAIKKFKKELTKIENIKTKKELIAILKKANLRRKGA